MGNWNQNNLFAKMKSPQATATVGNGGYSNVKPGMMPSGNPAFASNGQGAKQSFPPGLNQGFGKPAVSPPGGNPAFVTVQQSTGHTSPFMSLNSGMGQSAGGGSKPAQPAQASKPATFDPFAEFGNLRGNTLSTPGSNADPLQPRSPQLAQRTAQQPAAPPQPKTNQPQAARLKPNYTPTYTAAETGASVFGQYGLRQGYGKSL